jgi:hypothetical protein
MSPHQSPGRLPPRSIQSPARRSAQAEHRDSADLVRLIVSRPSSLLAEAFAVLYVCGGAKQAYPRGTHGACARVAASAARAGQQGWSEKRAPVPARGPSWSLFGDDFKKPVKLLFLLFLSLGSSAFLPKHQPCLSYTDLRRLGADRSGRGACRSPVLFDPEPHMHLTCTRPLR